MIVQSFTRLGLLASLLLSTALAVEWEPIDPAHLALTTPKVDKDADAEAIFWIVRIDDQAKGTDRTVLDHYIRIKVFTQRGVESQSAVELMSFTKGAVDQIRGRTVKPDGSIQYLAEDTIFERTLVKVRGLSLNVKSFALPGVEPGAIVEYQWHEIRDDSAGYMGLAFQREFPVWLVKYYIKPNRRLASVFWRRTSPDSTR